MVLMLLCMSKAVLQLTFAFCVAEVFRAVREAAPASSLRGGPKLLAGTEQLTMQTALLVQGTEHLVLGKTCTALGTAQTAPGTT